MKIIEYYTICNITKYISKYVLKVDSWIVTHFLYFSGPFTACFAVFTISKTQTHAKISWRDLSKTRSWGDTCKVAVEFYCKSANFNCYLLVYYTTDIVICSWLLQRNIKSTHLLKNFENIRVFDTLILTKPYQIMGCINQDKYKKKDLKEIASRKLF